MGLLDTEADPTLDALTALAAEIMDVPIALVSLVDVDRQWFKSRVGLAVAQTARDVSFCGHVVSDGAPMVVSDALVDPRFADNPLVTGDPRVRFYAGFPLRTSTGFDLGTLCTIDHRPRQPTDKQLRMLRQVATLVMQWVEAHRQQAAARQVVDGVPGMLAYWDHEQRCRFANLAYQDWFGISPEALLGKTLEELLGPIYPRNRPYIEAALRGEAQMFEREIPDRHGGPPRTSQAHYLPHVVEGQVLGFVVMVVDISNRKRLEAELTTTAQEREVLLKEVHHRVKNNLQIISSLINMQIDKLNDRPSIAALRDCQNRVLSISMIHQQLYQVGDFARVPFSDYARSVASAIFHAQGTSPNVDLELDVENVSLTVDTAVPCGLILSELITNALKHAFAGRARGELRVTMTEEPPGEVTLCVADDGVGLPPSFDLERSRSLGLQLIYQLTQQISGTVDITGGHGTTFRVRFPRRPS
ncbi:MAG: PAS domain-containing protein [Archangiaceae bacterium]|nr:PAS domain-containing protein [Archangiaceae bacterium]